MLLDNQRLRTFAFLDRLGALVAVTWSYPRKAHMVPAAEGALLGAKLWLQATRLVSKQSPAVRRNRSTASEGSLCTCRRRKGKVRAARGLGAPRIPWLAPHHESDR